MMDVHKKVTLSESFEGDRSRVIGNRCNTRTNLFFAAHLNIRTRDGRQWTAVLSVIWYLLEIKMAACSKKVKGRRCTLTTKSGKQGVINTITTKCNDVFKRTIKSGCL